MESEIFAFGQGPGQQRPERSSLKKMIKKGETEFESTDAQKRMARNPIKKYGKPDSDRKES